MDMLKLIEMINDSSYPALYKITLEEMNLRYFVPDREDQYYLRRFLQPPIQTRQFYDKNDVIEFLADKDLFGWEIRSWNFEQSFSKFVEVKIELYRINVPSLPKNN